MRKRRTTLDEGVQLSTRLLFGDIQGSWGSLTAAAAACMAEQHGLAPHINWIATAAAEVLARQKHGDAARVG